MDSVMKINYQLGLLFFIAISTLIYSVTASVGPLMAVDLGGEFIKVAVLRVGIGMEIALNEESSRKTSAIVAFQDGERHFASQAESTALRYPDRAVGYLMQILGKHFDDPAVQLYRERFPYYKLSKDEERGTVLFNIQDMVYSPEEILAMLLEKAKECAESFVRQEIKHTVLTVPPFYNQAERRAVQIAAELAGINLLHLMSDNAAVALNYGVFRLDDFKTSMKYYMFYDMGSTSTVATIVGYNKEKTRTESKLVYSPQLTVVGTGFDRTLGGLEFTLRLRAHLARIFNSQKKTELKVEESTKAMAKLWKEAERVKKVLSANADHTAQVENLLDEKDFRAHVTRVEFEQINQDLYNRVIKPIDDAIKASNLTLSQITDVILMGGGTRMPKVQEILMKHLGRTELGKSINTDEAAALGAVYRAAYYSKGFKIINFLVKEGNMYPINVEYEKHVTDGGGQVKQKMVKFTLYEHMSSYPQKRVATFTANSKDFSFNVTYSDPPGDRKLSRSTVISKYSLSLEKETPLNAGQTRGFQAHFHMNESGILIFDRLAQAKSNYGVTLCREVETTLIVCEGVGDGQKADAKGIYDSALEEGWTEEEQEEDIQVSDESKAKENGNTESSIIVNKTDSDSRNGEESNLKDENTETVELPDVMNDNTQTVDDLKDKETGDTTSSDTKNVLDEILEDTDQADVNEVNVTKNTTSETLLKEDSSEKVDIRGLKHKISKKKPQPSKKVDYKITTVKETVAVKQDNFNVKEMSKDKAAVAKQRLNDLRRADQDKTELERVKNELESFILDYQQHLKDELYIECSTEAERTDMHELLNTCSHWLYEESQNAGISDFTTKLNELQDQSKDISKRVYEMKKRPIHLKALNDILDSPLIEHLRKLPETASALFTKAEVEYLEETINKTKQWRDQKVAEQEKLKPYENPVLLSKHIVRKINNLKKEFKPVHTKLQHLMKASQENERQNPAAETDNLTETTTNLPDTEDNVKLEL